MEKLTKILIKLGTNCNLHCKHCHCIETHPKFNSDIIPYIKNIKGNKRITFSGGEPFLYWDIIKHIMKELGDSLLYKIVTNGTIMDNEKIMFLNQYNCQIILSYDGEDSERDLSITPNYKLFSKLKQSGPIASLVYNKNMDLRKLSNDIRNFRINNNLVKFVKNTGAFFPNFVHQTKDNPNKDITKDTVIEYCKQLAILLEEDMINYKNGNNINQLGILECLTFIKFKKKEYENGFSCCNESMLNLTIEGNFLLCPYGSIKVGDIYNGIDWNLVNSYKPDRCKKCELWDICRNQCIANVTDNECYIYKVIYKHYKKLLKKYDIKEEWI